MQALGDAGGLDLEPDPPEVLLELGDAVVVGSPGRVFACQHDAKTRPGAALRRADNHAERAVVAAPPLETYVDADAREVVECVSERHEERGNVVGMYAVDEQAAAQHRGPLADELLDLGADAHDPGVD